MNTMAVKIIRRVEQVLEGKHALDVGMVPAGAAWHTQTADRPRAGTWTSYVGLVIRVEDGARRRVARSARGGHRLTDLPCSMHELASAFIGSSLVVIGWKREREGG